MVEVAASLEIFLAFLLAIKIFRWVKGVYLAARSEALNQRLTQPEISWYDHADVRSSQRTRTNI